jgi:membrane associated rhomboid family serine protease
MIPLFDRNPSRRLPWVTIGLIVLNFAVFIYMLTLSRVSMDIFTYRYAAVPWELLHGKQLPVQDLMQLLPLTSPGVSKSIYFSLISCMFLHAGWLHILFNMLFLGIFGDNVEDTMGHLPFLVFYLVCGVAATMLHAVVYPNSIAPLVGASGAIAGVLGAYLVLFPRARIYALLIVIPLSVPAWVFIGVWIVYQFLAGFTSQSSVTENVAVFAHIGGVAVGVLITFVFYPILKRRRRPTARVRKTDAKQ